MRLCRKMNKREWINLIRKKELIMSEFSEYHQNQSKRYIWKLWFIAVNWCQQRFLFHCVMKNLPSWQHPHWTILHKDGNISQFFWAILLASLRSKKKEKEKNAFLENEHLDNTFPTWRLWCLKVALQTSVLTPANITCVFPGTTHSKGGFSLQVTSPSCLVNRGSKA